MRTSSFLGSLALCLVVSASASADQSAKVKSTHNVQIKKGEPHPAPMYSDVLKSMQDQVSWSTGGIRMLEKVRFAFLPEFKDPQHRAAYNAKTGARLGYMIKNAKGKVLSTVNIEAFKDKFPWWQGDTVGNSQPHIFSAGKYKLSYFLEGQPFWEVPFTVTKPKAGSAYEKGKWYFDGPWNKMAYIYVPNGNVSSSPTFNLFLRDKKSKPGSWIKKDISIQIKRGGKVVAVHPHGGRSQRTMRPWWERQEASLHSPTANKSFTGADLLKKGNYTVTVKLGGKRVGVYRYKVLKNGKLPMIGRQARGKAKPMSYLEGGTDRFYMFAK